MRSFLVSQVLCHNSWFSIACERRQQTFEHCKGWLTVSKRGVSILLVRKAESRRILGVWRKKGGTDYARSEAPGRFVLRSIFPFDAERVPSQRWSFPRNKRSRVYYLRWPDAFNRPKEDTKSCGICDRQMMVRMEAQARPQSGHNASHPSLRVELSRFPCSPRRRWVRRTCLTVHRMAGSGFYWRRSWISEERLTGVRS